MGEDKIGFLVCQKPNQTVNPACSEEMVMALKTIWLIDRNIGISRWKSVEELSNIKPNELDSQSRVYHSGSYGDNKRLSNTVNIIVNSMSHPDAVELIAQEWGLFPPALRMGLTDAMKEACGIRSGNKTKGIIRLDKMLGGKILAKIDNRRTDRDLRVIDGEVVSRQRRVNPAVAGAMRAHAEFVLPPNYNQLTPAEKKKIQKQMNKERRQDRKIGH